jgi:uncharacterized membrane protein
MEDQTLPYQLIIIAVISFVIYIVCASLGLVVAFSSDTIFSNEKSAKALKGAFTVLLGMATLLPILYFMCYYTKLSGEKEKNITQTKKSIFVIAFISYILMMLTASLGIWLSNCHTSTSTKPNVYEIVFIVILVVALILPIFFAIFYFQDRICDFFMKKT